MLKNKDINKMFNIFPWKIIDKVMLSVCIEYPVNRSTISLSGDNFTNVTVHETKLRMSRTSNNVIVMTGGKVLYMVLY